MVVCLYVTKTAQNNHQTRWSSVENIQKDMYWDSTPFASDNYINTFVTKKTVYLTLLLRSRAVCRVMESKVLRFSLKVLYKLPLILYIKKKQKEEEKVASSTATWTCHRCWGVRFDLRKKRWLKIKNKLIVWGVISGGPYPQGIMRCKYTTGYRFPRFLFWGCFFRFLLLLLQWPCVVDRTLKSSF